MVSYFLDVNTVFLKYDLVPSYLSWISLFLLLLSSPSTDPVLCLQTPILNPATCLHPQHYRFLFFGFFVQPLSFLLDSCSAFLMLSLSVLVPPWSPASTRPEQSFLKSELWITPRIKSLTACLPLRPILFFVHCIPATLVSSLFLEYTGAPTPRPLHWVFHRAHSLIVHVSVQMSVIKRPPDLPF